MDDSELRRLTELGLYDPEAPSADERRDLLEFLLGLGATTNEMVEVADVPGGLAGLAAVAAQPKPTVSLADMSARLGLSIEIMEENWVSLGLPLPPVDQPVFDEHEAELVATLTANSSILGRDAELKLLRAAGQSLARLADAVMQAYLFNIEQPGTTELVRARLAVAGQEMMHTSVEALEVILLRHMSEMAIRLRSSRTEDSSRTVLAIGFVDLVGFTPLSLSLDEASLDHLLTDFEHLATESVTANGGWVVKMIGDEVMFATLDVPTAFAVAVALFEGLGTQKRELTPTGGLDFGPVMARGGDYFGSVVNIAARAASAAVPGEMLVTGRVHEHAPSPPNGYVLESGGRRQLRGIDEPMALWSFHPVADPGE